MIQFHPLPAPANRFWTAEGTGMKFGGHTNRGTTTDPSVMAGRLLKTKLIYNILLVKTIPIRLEPSPISRISFGIEVS
jgi:hypothetical protein